MPNLTVTIPHQLGKAEARRRIEDGVGQLRHQQGMVTRLDERWEGDTLHYSAAAMGQSVSGLVAIEEAQVRVEVELPWMLAMLGSLVRQRIEQRGRDLLGSR
jgi:putative polyhydroxyalkanoate system protein